MTDVLHVVEPHALHLLVLALDLPLYPLYILLFLSNNIMHTLDCLVLKV